MWGAVVFLAFVVAASAVSEVSVVFPEDARDRSSQRIVSGWPAYPGEIPHQLSLRMVNAVGQVSSCGASLIHRQWGLTAAHCTAQRITLVIRAGTVNMTRPGLIFETMQYYNHPSYNEAIASIVQPDDIGLIKFNRDVEYNSIIKPVRIQRSADCDNNYDQVRLTASGWGRTWTAGDSPEVLNWVYLKGVSNAACRLAFNLSPIIQPTTICASGYNDTTQSTCQGDSGGPLTTVDEDGGLSIVGVTSFVSSQGCHVDIPAGFVRPGYYHDWFSEVTGINFDWDWEHPLDQVKHHETVKVVQI